MSFTPTKPSGATIRGPSRQLWNKARWGEIIHDPSAGFGFFDDFLFLPEGKYEVTNATAGTFNLIDGDGGIVEADTASSTDTQGVNVQLGGDEAGTTDASEMFLPEAGTEIVFEARFKVHDFGTDGAGMALFFGLSENDTNILGTAVTNANDSDNHIGFEAIGTNVVTAVGEKATARGTVASVATLVDSDVTADSWINLGMRVIGVTKAEIWVNDARNASTIATANIPIVEMSPSLCLHVDGGATDVLLRMDWWYCIKKNRIDTN